MNRGDPITAFQRLRDLGQAGAARIKRDGLHIRREIGEQCVKIRYRAVNKGEFGNCHGRIIFFIRGSLSYLQSMDVRVIDW